MSTTQINTLRGELLSEIAGVEEAEVLERIKRSIARILSKERAKKEETRPQTKEEIIADLHEVGEQIRRYTIRVYPAFKRQFKRLSKRYHSLEEDVRQLSESLLENP